MPYNSRDQELDRIAESLSERLRKVCRHMAAGDFNSMVRKMAEVQWRTEHRCADAFLVDMLYLERTGH